LFFFSRYVSYLFFSQELQFKKGFVFCSWLVPLSQIVSPFKLFFMVTQLLMVVIVVDNKKKKEKNEMQ